MENVSVQTTQQVHLDYEIAGIGDRIFAFLLDVVILTIYTIAGITWMIEMVGGGSTGFYYLIIFLPVVLYHLLFEFFWNGQSLGKRALGIKVVKMDGSRPGIGNYFIRWILRIVDIGMTTGMGAVFAILINGKGQRIGDMAAGTTVIKNRKRTSLNETMMTDIEEGYEPRFSSAATLTDQDVAIIKEVLNAKRKYESTAYSMLLSQTQKEVIQKLGITSNEMNAEPFLQTILKDYNYLHGQKE